MKRLAWAAPLLFWYQACGSSDHARRVPAEDGGEAGMAGEATRVGGAPMTSGGAPMTGGGAGGEATAAGAAGMETSVAGGEPGGSAAIGQAGAGGDSGGVIPIEPGQVGPSFPHAESSSCPIALAVTYKGTPLVAYFDPQLMQPIVAQFDGEDWLDLPAPSLAGSFVSQHCWSLALEDDDTPVLAVHELVAGTTHQKQVLRFNGTDWDALGAALPSDYYSTTLQVTKAPDGQLVLVTTAGFDIEVRRYNVQGDSWDLQGTAFHRNQALVAEAHLAFDAGGMPVVAFIEGVGGSNAASIFVSSFDGNAWNALGGVLDSVPNATESLFPPALAFDTSPVVAYIKKPPAYLGVRRWDGDNWLDEGFADQGTYAGGTLGLLVEAGKKTLAWPDEYAVAVRQYDGNAWSATSTAFNAPGIVHVALPALAAGGSRLFLSEAASGDLGYVVALTTP